MKQARLQRIIHTLLSMLRKELQKRCAKLIKTNRLIIVKSHKIFENIYNSLTSLRKCGILYITIVEKREMANNLFPHTSYKMEVSI